MNNICEVCAENYGEGNICRSCRKVFKVLSVDDEKFNECLTCQNCDMYWFPCLVCARDAFNYNLGIGHSHSDYFEGVLSFEEMFQVLKNKQQEILHENIIEDIKTSSKESYCSLQ